MKHVGISSGKGDRGPLEIASVERGDRRAPVARLTCAACGGTTERAISGGRGLAPELVLKTLRRRGWQCDGRNPSNTLCPACQRKRKDRRPMSDAKVTPLKPPPGTLKMSADQRLAIRQHLDAHFDDKAGRYLDGFSDQRIARDVGVPFAVVSDMRELAYGPITGDDEVEDLRKAIAELRKESTKIATRLDGMAQQIATAERRLEAIAERFAP